MIICQPASSSPGSSLAILAAVNRGVERRGGCCTPQHLIDGAHGDDPHTTNGGTNAQADDHMSVPSTAQSLVDCRL